LEDACGLNTGSFPSRFLGGGNASVERLRGAVCGDAERDVVMPEVMLRKVVPSSKAVEGEAGAIPRVGVAMETGKSPWGARNQSTGLPEVPEPRAVSNMSSVGRFGGISSLDRANVFHGWPFNSPGSASY
jgi:hypothetical protein